jgi:hypothetical protein
MQINRLIIFDTRCLLKRVLVGFEVVVQSNGLLHVRKQLDVRPDSADRLQCVGSHLHLMQKFR